MKDNKKLKDVLRFRLEFMLTMHNAGRDDMANEALERLFKLIDMVEGDYTPTEQPTN